MTNELREVLLKVEAAIQATKPILGRQSYTITDQKSQLRLPLLIGLMDQVIEHHEAMLLLIAHDMTGSAFALARPIVEGMYRGLWIDGVATDPELEHFIKKDEISVGMGKIAEAIDTAYGTNAAFTGLKKKAWGAPETGYTHNGILQVGRRFTKGEVKPAYTDGQKIEIIGDRHDVRSDPYFNLS